MRRDSCNCHIQYVRGPPGPVGSPEAATFNGDYTVGDNDYLLLYTGPGSNTVTLVPVKNGRIIVVANGGSDTISVLTTTTGLISPNVHATGLGSGPVTRFVAIDQGHAITFQYVTSNNTWVATGST